MKLDLLSNNTLLEFFNSDDSDGKIKGIIDRVLSPFMQSIESVVQQYMEAMDRKPYQTVTDARRTIEKLTKIAGPKSKMNILARRKHPESYLAGQKFMDKLYDKIKTVIERIAGELQENRLRDKLNNIAERQEHEAAPREVSIGIYIMLGGIVAPMLTLAAPIIMGLGVMSMTPKIAAVIGMLNWFMGLKELVKEE